MCMEMLLNVYNGWDGKVTCPEIMGPCYISAEDEVPVYNGKVDHNLCVVRTYYSSYWRSQ